MNHDKKAKSITITVKTQYEDGEETDSIYDINPYELFSINLSRDIKHKHSLYEIKEPIATWIGKTYLSITAILKNK